MIRLSLPKEPYWLDLPHDVRLQVRPLDTSLYEAARHKGARLAQRLISDHAEITLAGGTVGELPDLNDPDAINGLSQFLFTQALATLAIMTWEGVLDDKNAPCPVNETSVAMLMRIPSIADEFLRKYTKPHHDVLAEGNGSGLAPNGISAAGPNIAPDAAPTTPPAPAAE
ncbi:hypothetical protein [Thalassospira sp. TSL5-1]|uniref:hypothetical protein n=1 Tax=Thalassospira sp. TSL5-1 TaxID=1544451 RepID=UPI000940253A|nr:hypothetical protein [Thalassospira sp. TSL5-1]OKH89211.1 hypothetical protein LF95_04045 [Thalassospira sp. TSL5-1]